MATAKDAELILELYHLRTEKVMREARHFVMNWEPQSFDEILALQRDMASVNNGYWRQVLGYWEMAASFVLHGVLDPDLFLDSNGEPFFLYAKYAPFREQYREAIGIPFMRQVGKMIETYPLMQERYTMMLTMMEARQKRVQA